MAAHHKNQVTLRGNVGNDPEIRRTQAGGKIANFSLATSKGIKDKDTGEWKDQTQWHKIVVFAGANGDGLAGTVEQKVRKGDLVEVTGELSSRKYTDQAGQERYITEIIVGGFRGELTVFPKGDRSNGTQAQASQPKPAAKPSPKQMIDDEIPF